MPKTDLAMAWQVRQARSKGFKGLVRKQIDTPAEVEELPLEAADAASEQHSELSTGSAEPKAPAASLLKDIVSRIRREGL